MGREDQPGSGADGQRECLLSTGRQGGPAGRKVAARETLTGTPIHPMPSAHPAVGRGPVRSGRHPPLAGCPIAALVPIRSDLDRARHVAAVRCHRSLDLRHVTERRFVHLRKYRAPRHHRGMTGRRTCHVSNRTRDAVAPDQHRRGDRGCAGRPWPSSSPACKSRPPEDRGPAGDVSDAGGVAAAFLSYPRP